jgi:hypothetical protein
LTFLEHDEKHCETANVYNFATVAVALWATRDASHPPSQRYGVAGSEAATALRLTQPQSMVLD